MKYVESPPEAYTRGELQDLFRVSSERDKFRWRFFLGTGFRETEVAVAEKTDINRDTKTIRVDEKRYFDFKPKDCEKCSVLTTFFRWRCRWDDFGRPHLMVVV